MCPRRALLFSLIFTTLLAGCKRDGSERPPRAHQPDSGSLGDRATAPPLSALPVTAIATDWADLLERGTKPGFSPPAELLNEGEALAKVHCAACHVLPEPAVLPKRAWAEVFAALLSIFRSHRILEDPEAIRIPNTTPGLFAPPWKPQRQYRFKNHEFFKAAAYYLHAAPVESLPVENRPKFSARPLPFRIKSQAKAPSNRRQPEYTVSVIDETRGRLVLGDNGFLRVFDASGRKLKDLPIPGVPTSLSFEPDGVYVTVIGPTYVVTPDALGQVIRFPNSALEPGNRQTYASVLTGLLRPVHARIADLDGDGAKDILVDEFGMEAGALGWYRRKPGASDHYEYRTIIEGTGALGAAVVDANRDGFPDIMAMFAQSDESIYLALNDAKGNFKVSPLHRSQPAFGYNSMAVADINGDGRDDIVTANGDTLPSMPLKNYHGVRVLADNGHGGYVDSYFYPLPGALIVKAGDIDNDGDADILATAFFTDANQQLQEPVVLLENLGGMTFAPHRLPGGADGLWVDVGIGDVDRDGDKDLLLGAAYPQYVESIAAKSFPDGRIAFELLENTSTGRGSTGR